MRCGGVDIHDRGLRCQYCHFVYATVAKACLSSLCVLVVLELIRDFAAECIHFLACTITCMKSINGHRIIDCRAIQHG